MFAAVLALSASVSWGVADFVAGLKTKTLHVLVVGIVSQLAGFAILGTIVLANGGPAPPTRTFWLAAVAGVSGSAGLLGLYRGLAIGQMGIVAPISATSAVIPVVVGLARGERPSELQLAGIALTLLGIVLASRERDGASGRRVAIGVEMGLLAALGLGFALVFLDAAAEGDRLWAPLALRAAALVMLGLAAAVVRPSFAMRRRDVGALAGVGFADNAANLGFVFAAGRGLLSVVAVLASLYPVVTALLARFVLDERLVPVQLVGVALALGGVAMITGG
jgi:drug/metabolite transporter (DMT)-like permease